MLINFPEPLTEGNVKAIEFFRRLKELENELYNEYFDNAMKLQDKWDKTDNNEYKKRYEKQGDRLNKNFLDTLEIEIKKLEKEYNAKRISVCFDPNAEKRTMVYALPAIS